MKTTLMIGLALISLLSCSQQKPAEQAEGQVFDGFVTDTNDVSPMNIVSIYLVTDMKMPDGNLRNVKNANVTVEVQSTGRLMGNSGCNQFNGGYTYKDGIFKADKVISTRKMCAENMDVENAFLNYLNMELNVYNIDRGLELRVNNQIVMKLKKIDE